MILKKKKDQNQKVKSYDTKKKKRIKIKRLNRNYQNTILIMIRLFMVTPPFYKIL